MKLTLTTFINFTICRQNLSQRSCLNFYGIALLSSTLLFFTFPVISFAENSYNILLVSSNNSGAYEKTTQHIKNTIKISGTRPINIDTITIEEYYARHTPLVEKTDIIVPIGQRALKETLKYSGKTPVLATLISKYDFDLIIRNIMHYGNNIGAIYIDQPLDRHLLFSELVLPDINRFSFIINENNKYVIDKLNLLNHDNYRIGILKQGDNVLSTLSYILNDAGALIAVPDPIIFNLRTTRSILLSTYRKRVPLIGFSESYAKAGALAALYSTPELIGKQTGEVISLFINRASSKSDPFFLPRLHAKYFSISINKNVARSLGLPVLDAGILEKNLLEIENDGVNKPDVKM